MKRAMLLSVIAALAVLAFGATAAAQAQLPKAAMKEKVLRVACKGNAAACTKLDLYQKMAATGSNTSAAARGGSSSGALRSHAVHNGRAAGGAENNPAAESGSASRARAERRELRTQTNHRQNRAPHFLRAREVNRSRPSDF